MADIEELRRTRTDGIIFYVNSIPELIKNNPSTFKYTLIRRLNNGSYNCECGIQESEENIAFSRIMNDSTLMMCETKNLKLESELYDNC